MNDAMRNWLIKDFPMVPYTGESLSPSTLLPPIRWRDVTRRDDLRLADILSGAPRDWRSAFRGSEGGKD